MKSGPVVLAFFIMVFVAALPAAAYSFTLSSPGQATIGDSVTLNGTVKNLTVTSVYLLVTGPGINPNGATLENIHEASGSLTGMFTIVPVDIVDNTFSYRWDTSPFKNSMESGHYTVYVMAAPMELNKLAESGEAFGSTSVLLLASDETLPPTETQSPLSPSIVLASLGIAVMGIIGLRGRKKR